MSGRFTKWRHLVSVSAAAARGKPGSRVLNTALKKARDACTGAVLPGHPKDRSNPCFQLYEAAGDVLDALHLPARREAQLELEARVRLARTFLVVAEEEETA